jgi:Asp/Glu/hydantoin racemase
MLLAPCTFLPSAGTGARVVSCFDDTWIARVQAVKPGTCYKAAATVGTCALVAKRRPSVITCLHVWEAIGGGEEAWVWLTKADIAFHVRLTDRVVDEDLALLDPLDPLSDDVIRRLPEPPPL